MSNIFMRLAAKCAYAVFSILLGGFLISTVCATYIATPAYATLATNHIASTSEAAVSGHMLTALPHALQLWTSITLAWGIAVCTIYCHMHHRSKWNRNSDTRVTASLWAYNIAIALFLLFGHLLAPGVGEPFFIFILFYNSFLALTSVNIVHWWKYHMDDEEATDTMIVNVNAPIIALNESPSQKLRALQLNESPTQKMRRLQAAE